jgi:hypothetical protein
MIRYTLLILNLEEIISIAEQDQVNWQNVHCQLLPFLYCKLLRTEQLELNRLNFNCAGMTQKSIIIMTSDIACSLKSIFAHCTYYGSEK